jgi:hypothetical protein
VDDRVVGWLTRIAAVGGGAGLVACLVTGVAVSGCSALLDLDVRYTDGGAPVVEAGPVDEGGMLVPDAAPLGGDAGDAGPDATVVAMGPDAGPDGASPIDASTPPDATPVTPVTGIQYVQGAAAANANGASSVTVQLGQPVAAGDAIIVAADATTDKEIKVTDSFGSVYTIPTSVDDGNGIEAGIGYALDVTGGAETLTFTIDSTDPINFLEVYVHEYSGIAAFDGANGASGTSMLMQSGPVTTTAQNDLLFAFGATGQASPGSGFTSRLTFNSNLSEDEILQTPATVQATMNMVSGTDWILNLAAFKPR